MRPALYSGKSSARRFDRGPAAALDWGMDARRRSLLIDQDVHVRAHADRFGIFWVTDDGGVVVQVTLEAAHEALTDLARALTSALQTALRHGAASVT